MRPSAPTLAALAITALAAACDVAAIRDPVDASPRDTVAADTAADARDSASDLTPCLPGAAETGCPADAFCETTARVCVDCVARTERCGADGAREICEAPAATGVGQLSGGFFAPAPCTSGTACVARSATAVTCAPVVCEAGFATCADARVLECNSTGTEEKLVTCPPGRACYDGRCDIIRHNVLVIFDTSQSMNDYIFPSAKTGVACGPGEPACPFGHTCSSATSAGECLAPGSATMCAAHGGPCLEPFPVCDDLSAPMTLLGLSKVVFDESVRTAIGGFAHFALQVFPQREAAPNPPACYSGWYTSAPNMTGDDGAVDTATGRWFADHLGEAFVVPFPRRNTLDNTAELLTWVDGAEILSATDTPCQSSADCGGASCGRVNGEGRCFVHSNNELRGQASTPLGKSLFYAGEYFRRFVRVDGKPCQSSADCGSSGYMCKDDVCLDPYRKCRDDFIILFTDGYESYHTSPIQFFNPAVQARRLAFGLDCATDAECRGGASCNPEGRCVRPGEASPVVRADGGGYGALSSPDGQPVSIRTTVITLQAGGAAASQANDLIANAGGGLSINVTATDRAALKQALIQAMSPNFKCAPEDLDTEAEPTTP